VRAENQGFVDLHTPFGFFLIGTAFLLFSVLIILGAIYGRTVAARDREARQKLAEEVRSRHSEPKV